MKRNEAVEVAVELARQDTRIANLEAALASQDRALEDAVRRAEAAEERAAALHRAYDNAGVQVRAEMNWRQAAIVRAEAAEQRAADAEKRLTAMARRACCVEEELKAFRKYASDAVQDSVAEVLGYDEIVIDSVVDRLPRLPGKSTGMLATRAEKTEAALARAEAAEAALELAREALELALQTEDEMPWSKRCMDALAAIRGKCDMPQGAGNISEESWLEVHEKLEQTEARAEAAQQRAADAEHKTAAWKRAAKSWEARVADLRPRAEAAEAALAEAQEELATLKWVGETVVGTLREELSALRAVAVAVRGVPPAWSPSTNTPVQYLRRWASFLYQWGEHRMQRWLISLADALAALNAARGDGDEGQ